MTDDFQKQGKIEMESTAPIQLSNQKLQFPVTYRLKAVMATTPGDVENKQQLIDVFNKLDVRYSYQGRNKSSKGTYVSFTYEVTLNDRQTMNQLYALLKEIENLKFAL